MTGQTVSHYRILEKIGGGGMGVVYLAEDTRLGRQVALKFLPESIAADPLGLDRFRREARAASAINHPNICTIYDIGQDEEGRPFLAMEYLEGTTLKHRIEEGRPVPLPQIADWAVQIADALDAAHSKGIIHRDIKPANLFITTRQQAKVLDFGLAKVAADRARVGPSDLTATLSVALETSSGSTVGTICYMSPEQARGEDLDARTDLFSFGAVLYELATGSLPFEGKTTALVFNALLTSDPIPPSAKKPAVPADFERIVMRLLEKDRSLRYQSAADLAADLRRVQRDSTQTITAARPVARQSGRGGFHVSRAAIAATVSIAGILLAIWNLNRTKETKPEAPHPAVQLRRITANPSEHPVTYARISPDGQFIAYSDPGGIHMYKLQNSETRLLPNTEGMTLWGWAPGGTTLFAIKQRLDSFPQQFALDVIGGVDVKPVDWSLPSPDGSKVMYWDERGALHIRQASGGGDKLVMAAEDRPRDPRDSQRPLWSPNSKKLVWVRHDGPGFYLVTYDIASGNTMRGGGATESSR